MNEKQIVTMYFDGACHNKRDKATHMGIGVVANISKGEEIAIAEYKGLGTSNIAEWEALCRCLELALEVTKLPTPSTLSSRKYFFNIFGDSQLIVNQFNGVFRIKESSFEKYYHKAHQLIAMINTNGHKVQSIDWIRREKNTRADELSKEGLAKRPVDDIELPPFVTPDPIK